MKLQIKTTNQNSFKLDVDLSKTVYEFKKELSLRDDIGVQAEMLELIYVGKILRNDDKLSVYNLDAKELLEVIMLKQPEEAVCATSYTAAEPTAPSFYSDSTPPVGKEAGAMAIDPSVSIGVDLAHDELVENVIGMGFPDVEMRKALAASSNNPELAIPLVTERMQQFEPMQPGVFAYNDTKTGDEIQYLPDTQEFPKSLVEFSEVGVLKQPGKEAPSTSHSAALYTCAKQTAPRMNNASSGAVFNQPIVTATEGTVTCISSAPMNPSKGELCNDAVVENIVNMGFPELEVRMALAIFKQQDLAIEYLNGRTSDNDSDDNNSDDNDSDDSVDSLSFGEEYIKLFGGTVQKDLPEVELLKQAKEQGPSRSTNLNKAAKPTANIPHTISTPQYDYPKEEEGGATSIEAIITATEDNVTGISSASMSPSNSELGNDAIVENIVNMGFPELEVRMALATFKLKDLAIEYLNNSRTSDNYSDNNNSDDNKSDDNNSDDNNSDDNYSDDNNSADDDSDDSFHSLPFAEEYLKLFGGSVQKDLPEEELLKQAEEEGALRSATLNNGAKPTAPTANISPTILTPQYDFPEEKAGATCIESIITVTEDNVTGASSAPMSPSNSELGTEAVVEDIVSMGFPELEVRMALAIFKLKDLAIEYLNNGRISDNDSDDNDSDDNDSGDNYSDDNDSDESYSDDSVPSLPFAEEYIKVIGGTVQKDLPEVELLKQAEEGPLRSTTLNKAAKPTAPITNISPPISTSQYDFPIEEEGGATSIEPIITVTEDNVAGISPAPMSPSNSKLDDDEQVKNLVSMGFPEVEVRKALASYFNQPDYAIEYLINSSICDKDPDANFRISASEFFHNNPHFRNLRGTADQNIESLDSVARLMGEGNPAVVEVINENRMEILNPLVEIPDDADDDGAVNN